MAKYLNVYHDIKNAIETGVYKPGEKLPSEKELMVSYKFSRVTIIQAMNKLRDARLVIRRVGDGTFVADILPVRGRLISVALVLLGPNSELEESIRSCLKKEGISLAVFYSDDDAVKEREILRRIIDSGAAGIVCYPLLYGNNGNIWDSLIIKGFPIVFIDRYPKNIVFLSARASLFAEIGSFNNALIDYCTILDENPNNEEALYQRGLLYAGRKEFDKSAQDFYKMLELNPQSLYGRLGLASLYKIEGNYTEAEKIYNYLEDKEPEIAGIYSGRAELFILMEKGNKALSDINRAIRLSENQENPYLFIIRAKAKLLLFEKKPAAEDIQKAISLGYDKEAAEVLLNQIGNK